MTRANRLGCAAAVFAVLACTPPYETWKQPVNAALFIAACVMGYFAARSGSRWWFAVPAAVGALLLTVLVLAFRSYN